jgi:ABC-type glycerol-3-phosphate transport system substrate-binding protein
MKRFTTIFLLFTLLITLGAGCGGSSTAEIAATTPVRLTIWRVFDDDDTLKTIMNNYRALHPNVSFDYRELRYDEYQDELLRAFAEGTGPDIFSIHNTWIGEYENLIQPLPDTVTIPYTETRGSIKKEQVTTLIEETTISQRQLETDFVEIVSHDVVRDYQPNIKLEAEERIFGLPLSVDTMVLFYNRDLLSQANIAQPPTTWTQFQENVAALTSIGTGDTVLQAGAALGTSNNVERSFDVLSLLMMQNGVQMTNDRGNATFAESQDRSDPASFEALRFYTDFANPLKQVYTWNNDMEDSFDAFTNGKTAFFFGYSYHIPLIETQNPKLDYAISSAPQIEGGRTVNYANYWVETVAKSTPSLDWAWDFIEYATSANQVVYYLGTAQKPTALRGLINTQLEDEVLYPFATQLLTAKSWYLGDNADVAEEAFNDMIDEALAGAEVETIVGDAQNKVNQTL